MAFAPSAEFKEDAVPTARVLPVHVGELRADDAAAAALQAAVGDQGHAAVAFGLVAGGRAHVGAGLLGAVVGADLGVLDLDVGPTRVHAVAVLKQFLFDIHGNGAHRKALQSLTASPTRPVSEREVRKLEKISRSLVFLSTPSTVNILCAALDTSSG